MAASDLIWTEKYRPRSVADLVLPLRVLDKVSSGAYQNLLLYGPPGSGKTSAAKVIAAGSPSMFVNCSLRTGVDDVRNSITDFCVTASVIDDEHSMKVVVLDEFDGVSDQYFKALRGTIEQFHATTRFVATTNHFTRIPEAIQSRFECVSFEWTPEEEADLRKGYIRRAYQVITAEGMKTEKDALVELVDRNFPDMRRIVSTLQGLHKDGVTTLTSADVSKYRGTHRALFELVCSARDPVGNYKSLSAYASSVDDAMVALGRDFLDYLRDERPELMKHIGQVTYEVNRHSYESRFAIDPLVTLLSLAFKLQTTLSS
jgi:replication-associated recombination protein RarA